MQKSPLRNLPLLERNKRLKPCLLHPMKQNSQRNLRMKGRRKQSPQKKPKRSKACLALSSGICVEFWRKSGSTERKDSGRDGGSECLKVLLLKILLRKKLLIMCSCCSQACEAEYWYKISFLLIETSTYSLSYVNLNNVKCSGLFCCCCSCTACWLVLVPLVLLLLCIFPKREGSV